MTEWKVTASVSGLVLVSNWEKLARESFATHCDHAATRSGETVTLWRDGKPVASFDGTGEPARFLAYCLARVNAGEFWQRLAGSVRKAGTL